MASAIERVRKSAAAARAKTEIMRRRHTVMVGAMGLAIGYAEKKGKRLPRLIEAVPIPSKAQWALVAAYASDHSSGDVKEYLRAAADGLAAISGYEQGKAGFSELVSGRG
jgi:hypothetical protein